jgi:hypothetical protein
MSDGTKGGQGANRRPPHPATVVQPRPAFGSMPARPPHPATVAQPKAPHAARFQGADRSYLSLVQPAAGPDVTGWKFKKFDDYMTLHPKPSGEGWDAYATRLKQTFNGYNSKDHDKFFNNAIETAKKKQAPKAPTKVESKAKLWSRVVVFRNDAWRVPGQTRNMRGQRPSTNGHAEQVCYIKMEVHPDDWIGFVQNEYPCIGEGCCTYFANVSKTVRGVIFNVVDSGGYALEHGRKVGSSAVIYFIGGEMFYDAPPEGAGAPEPPPE